MKDNVIYVDFSKPRHSNVKSRNLKPSLFLKIKTFMMKLLGKGPQKKNQNYDPTRLIR